MLPITPLKWLKMTFSSRCGQEVVTFRGCDKFLNGFKKHKFITTSKAGATGLKAESAELLPSEGLGCSGFFPFLALTGGPNSYTIVTSAATVTGSVERTRVFLMPLLPDKLFQSKHPQISRHHPLSPCL
jgi:hypothetical protein